MKKSEVTYTFTHKELLKIYHQGYRAGVGGMDWEDVEEIIEKEFEYKWKDKK